MADIQIKKVKLTEIRLNPDNPRRIGNAEMEKLVKSLKEFPEMLSIREIVVDETMTILGGNMRYLALKKAGAKECHAKIVSGLSPEQKREFVIKDNSSFGQWDMDALANEWGDLPLADWGVALPEDWLGGKPEAVEDDFDADAAAEAIVEPITKTGDVWLLGKHRVMCGDSTKKEDVGRLCAKQGVNLLLTDPPYGVSYAAKNEYLNAISPGNRIQTPIKNDHESPEDMKKLWVAAFTEAHDALAPGAAYYVTGPQGGDLLLLLLLSLKESGLILKHMLIWVKNNHVLGRADYNYKHEPIIYGWKAGGHKFYGPSNEVSTWQINKPQKSDLHPTMKPVELFARAITNSTQANAIVYDPFCGSGTSVIACEQLNRICYGMEIDSVYVQVILERWMKLTGKQPILEATGQTYEQVRIAADATK